MLYPIKPITAKQICYATGGELVFGSTDAIVRSVSCDSRTIESDSLFIPIKGERFDGHTFLEDVCNRGVGGYIFSEEQAEYKASFAIKVKDTSKALLDIASFYRSQFDIPVVALTGSVGKTTTKELVASVVSAGFNVLATKGNLNNNFGVPYTLFGLNSNHTAAVIEMGMSNFGEIEVLSKCARPDIAIITNIGTSHIEFLGSQEGILKAKSEIFRYLSPEGKVILNGDDPYLLSLKGTLPFETIYVGIENKDCDIVAENVESNEEGCTFDIKGKKYKINLAGAHNVYNALSAYAVGIILGMDEDKIYSGLENYHSDGIRQNIISVNGCKIINDCYNSSPQSAIASLSVLSSVKADRRIAVLGDIAELGPMTEELHRVIGKSVCDGDVDVLVTVGDHSSYIADECPEKEKYHFADSPSAGAFLASFVKVGDAVLIKGSRFMKMEQISEILKKEK